MLLVRLISLLTASISILVYKTRILYMKKRIKRLWKMIRHAGVDGIMITSNEMIRYLTGFTGSESILLIGTQDVRLVVDSRYTEQAGQECRGVEITENARKMDGAVQSLSEMGWKKIGFDPEKITVWQKKQIEQGGLFELIELPNCIHSIRSKKDVLELKFMRKAAAIASDAFLEVISAVRAGQTEKDVALQLEYVTRQRGAEAVSFPIIVVSGVRGALPHGRASGKKIEKGELVTIDFGSVYKGYCSDETCTVVVGRPGSRQRKIYQVVKNAHDEAISIIRQGIKVKEIDAAARKVVAKAGLGRYFRHGTGHGVGLAVHEEPRIAAEQETRVEKDMVFTIEPGVYIPGWGGVRIEDMVRVTNGGCELLSSVGKDLLSI